MTTSQGPPTPAGEETAERGGSTAPRPSRESARIVGVDVARGLAVLGMFGAHVGVTEAFDWSRPDTWLDVVDGRSSVLFALLAGLSIAIISGRMRPVDGVELVQARVRIFTRAALIFALGGLLEALETRVAVILPAYALLFLLILPFLRWRVPNLFLLAGGLSVVMPILHAVLVPEGALRGSPTIIDLLVTGTYPGMIWIVFFLAGLGIGRLDLLATAVRVRLLAVGLALAAAGYGLGFLAASTVDGDSLLFTIEAHSGSTFEVVGSTGFAIALLALCLFIADGIPWIVYPIAAVGSMALTAYSVHLLVAYLLGDVVATQLNNTLYVQFVGGALIACSLWKAFVGRGLLEQILTWVSRRAARITPAAAGRLGRDSSKGNTTL